MKKFLREKIGPHAFMREIPGEDAGTNLVRKYREDYNVHTAAQCCITAGVLEGVAYLDVWVVAELNDSTVMVISATSRERGAFLANICQCTAVWAMFTLVFEHNATPASVEDALKSQELVRDRAHNGCHGVLSVR